MSSNSSDNIRRQLYSLEVRTSTDELLRLAIETGLAIADELHAISISLESLSSDKEEKEN